MSQEGFLQADDPTGMPQISDDTLENVAEAYEQIQEINQEFQAAVQDTQEQEERQLLQEEATEKIIKAVEDTGIDVKTYNETIVQIRTNEQLASRFFEFLDE